MRWTKITLRLSDLELQKQLNNSFMEIYKVNNEPKDLCLYQADPEYYIDFFISFHRSDSWILSDLRKKFNAIDVEKPDTTNLFLIIGEKKTTTYVPLLI